MNFFTHLTNWLFSVEQPAKSAYTTIVYPVQGKAIVLHDGLAICHERPWYQLSDSLLRQDDTHTLFDSKHNDSSAWDNPGAHFQADDLAVNLMTANDVTAGVNPANGLPMMDGCIDVMGNPFGTDMLSDSCSSGYGLGDFGSSFPCFDFG